MEISITRQYFHATYEGKGEFYTSIGAGDRVLVEEQTTTYTYNGKRKASVSLAIQKLSGSAWLSLSDSIEALTDIVPFEAAIHGKRA